ncbi:MAG: hypothetical protein ACP5GT_03785, partial [Conexivisphaera sp.]
MRVPEDVGARLRASVPGAFVLKLPSLRGSPSRLAVDEAGPQEEEGTGAEGRGGPEEFRGLSLTGGFRGSRRSRSARTPG